MAGGGGGIRAHGTRGGQGAGRRPGARAAVAVGGPPDGERRWILVLAGVLRSLAVVGGFASVGLGAALSLRAAGPAMPGVDAGFYTRAAMPADRPATLPTPLPTGTSAGETLWLVDGFNVLHVGVLRGRAEPGWWGREGRSRVLERAARFRPAAGPPAGDEPRLPQVVVVFDGPDPAEPGPGSPRVVFAPSADAWLLARVREATAPERVVVVTADRRLAARTRARGGQVLAPAAFLAQCDPPEPPPGAGPADSI